DRRYADDRPARLVRRPLADGPTLTDDPPDRVAVPAHAGRRHAALVQIDRDGLTALPGDDPPIDLDDDRTAHRIDGPPPGRAIIAGPGRSRPGWLATRGGRTRLAGLDPLGTLAVLLGSEPGLQLDVEPAHERAEIVLAGRRDDLDPQALKRTEDR